MKIFFIYLDILKRKDELYEYRYQILEYIFGKFVCLKNDNGKNIFLKSRNILSKSTFFVNIFKENKYNVRIPNYININNTHLKFIYCYLKMDNIFYFNYIKNLKYYEFEELIKILKYIDLLKLDKSKLLIFYKDIIDISYDKNLVNYNHIKVKYLIESRDEFIL